ncbi:hypothetical protein, partial [Chryseobacterium sp.]|uniref:hypothetical protein n=1 Tax=Chryseobacterium sp. TaxID=1871047 RepID=UPI00321AB8AA
MDILTTTIHAKIPSLIVLLAPNPPQTLLLPSHNSTIISHRNYKSLHNSIAHYFNNTPQKGLRYDASEITHMSQPTKPTEANSFLMTPPDPQPVLPHLLAATTTQLELTAL